MLIKYLMLGVISGVISCIPIGPVNVAVIDASFRHTIRRAVSLGLGGAMGDGIYALLGVVILGPVFLEQHPGVRPVMYAISGVILLIYGVLSARSVPMPDVDGMRPKTHNPSDGLLPGVWIGLGLIVFNPAALIAWVAIGGTLIKVDTTTQGLLVSVGVLGGSFGWFSLIAYLTHRGKRMLGGRAVWITRIVGYILAIYAIYCLVQAVRYWFFE